jgi:hypothetical protein
VRLGRRRALWYAAAFFLGLAYPAAALLGRPAAVALVALPLLLVGWLTRPLHPGERLAGFAVFAAGAGTSLLLGWP